MPTSYLDAAAAVPLHPVARAAWEAAVADGWADPRAAYAVGRRSRALLDAARAATADALGCHPDGVSFWSGGSDAARQAVLGTLRGRRRAGDTLVHSTIEHSSVLDAAHEHAAAGGVAAPVPCDPLGRTDPDALVAAAARPGVAAVALMAANHEVGTTQPVAAVAERCAAIGVPLVVDASQTVPWDVTPPGWDVLSAGARKWGGPPGVGVVAVRPGVRWDPGPGRRTPDVPAVVAAAAALRAARADAAAERQRVAALTDRLRREVPALVPDTQVHGDPVDRVPHIAAFSFLYVSGDALQHRLDAYGIAVSTGSACSPDRVAPSHVLVAMGALTHGNVRVSLHRGTTSADVDRFLAVLPGVVTELRAGTGAEGL